MGASFPGFPSLDLASVNISQFSYRWYTQQHWVVDNSLHSFPSICAEGPLHDKYCTMQWVLILHKGRIHLLPYEVMGLVEESYHCTPRSREANQKSCIGLKKKDKIIRGYLPKPSQEASLVPIPFFLWHSKQPHFHHICLLKWGFVLLGMGHQIKLGPLKQLLCSSK